MKIFHTADWHLGKLVQGVSMTADQQHVLQQFIEEIKKEKPDVVIIAGDLYDRSVPPTDAIQLLNRTLKQILIDEKTPIVAIAGNHDSATRLNFGSDLMKASGLHMVGHLDKIIEPVILHDEHGEVRFYLVPFAEPSTVRAIYEDETITTHEAAMAKIIEQMKANLDDTKRNIIVGHAFITKDGMPEQNTSDSERKLTIGGTECINSALFEPFCYTALGHLHQAHFVGNETIQYAGSPLKYSESEVTHKKGFLIVDLDETGNVKLEKRLLTPIREMRIVTGTLDEIQQHPRNEDYVFVKLSDESYVKGAVELVRTVYPNALHIERTAVYRQIEQQTTTMSRVQMDDSELFELFYIEMTGQTLSDETKAIYTEVLQQLADSEREMQEVK
ncbi:exonuclease sbcCD subunit D [Lysinibacillus sp. 2017]|uniref:exonuclease SbcCD subunit D n=1 Tax=unclassified Lysinibacillus TaxID=2636778 RepID=UPI000D525EFE|nr:MULTISPECIES: exonuclease SbcCD subunit D [unclassified Lysinibacillus]AWE08765.1 exonuclease sbcCD subunit D [Lysinibacillus sp. 2017]TGN36088.1 exonuclease SbcCD subunit D [Lysinibacillus sp. S2017]